MLVRVRQHRLADQLVKGLYWEEGKGCAVGCTIHGDDHEEYEKQLGIPEHLAHLEDKFFEGMENEKSMMWPERFLAAIEPGADLSLVWPKFARWLLSEFLPEMHVNVDEDCIELVCRLLDRRISGDMPNNLEWQQAEKAARDATRRSVHTSVAWAVVRAEYAPMSAWTAVQEASWSSGICYGQERAEVFAIMADKLIELLRKAPVDEA
jgi:hypothetical protein